MYQTLLIFLSVLLVACNTTPPAPVIDRVPSSTKAKDTSKKEPAPPKTPYSTDWRPDSYIVKKGDTLYAIGLEFGYDYKEIAATNNLVPPYSIKIGQKLILPNGTKDKMPMESSDVIVTPVKTESAPVEIKSSPSSVTPIINHPKAVREVYTVEAFNKVVIPVPTKPSEVVTKPNATTPPTETASKPTDVKITETKPLDDEGLSWSWPTNGKVIANFSEAANKGIDIGGVMAQPINAASSGKVIYSGSDLRGYGKLVIIKHNKNYLSVYAHNSKILVKEGQQVTSGQKIAEMGNTDSSNIKLHFEIRRQGKSVDPMKFLN